MTNFFQIPQMVLRRIIIFSRQTQFQGIIFVGFDDFENKKMPEIIEGQVKSHKHITAAFVINTRYPQEVGRRYYGKKLDDIITAICRKFDIRNNCDVLDNLCF